MWIEGRLVREVSENEIRSAQPTVIGLADTGIEPGRPFRLTVKVTSPNGPGGLIGPVYVARPEKP